MSSINRTLTGRERTFPETEIIVSKTDRSSRLTYVNDIFCEVSGYSEAEALGKAHNLVRHPDTPRCLFKLMWDTIGRGEEIFAYLNNRAKNGDHYWVLAHVTADRDDNGQISGFHSNRRTPRRDAVEKINPLYQRLRAIEHSHADPKDGLEASFRLFLDILNGEGKSYAEFVLGL
ncbi:MAG: PAS domain-containing protein [Telmatospirillum sp.]|nr:PAS domain-containing protein [Telmatospirillum sp.]